MSRFEEILQSIIDGGDPAELQPPESRNEVLMQAVAQKMSDNAATAAAQAAQLDQIAGLVDDLANGGVDATARAALEEIAPDSSGASDPTESTVGIVSQRYLNTTTGAYFVCQTVLGEIFTWVPVGGASGASSASDVSITDAGGYYASENAEGALQEIGLALAGKAAASHDHAIENVTGLDTALAGKATKAASPTAGHIATLDADGNPADSGHTLSEYATMTQVNGRYRLEFFSASSLMPFSGAAIASGSSGDVYGEAKHPGIIRYLSHASNANSGYRVGAFNKALRLSGNEKVTYIFKTATVLTGVTRRLGFHDATDQNAPANGVHCKILDGVLTGQTVTATTTSTTGTSYTLSADTWYRLVVQLNSDATLATYTLYADDSTTALWSSTLSTNIPTGASNQVGCGDVCTLATSTGVAAIGYICYLCLDLPNTRRTE